MTEHLGKKESDTRIKDILKERVQAAAVKDIPATPPKAAPETKKPVDIRETPGDVVVPPTETKKVEAPAKKVIAQSVPTTPTTAGDRDSMVDDFVDNDLPALIEAGKKLLAPPFEMQEPFVFIRAASVAVQNAFSAFVGADRRAILMAVITFLRNGPLKEQMKPFSWLLDSALLGWVYDNFVKGKI